MKKTTPNVLAATLLAAALLFGTGAHAQQPVQQLDRIAAVVNEDVILQSELDRAVGNVLGQYANRQDQLPPRDILERQVLERLILVRLQTERASESGVRVGDEEVDAAISNIAQQNKLTPDQMRQQLAKDGMSYDDFRTSIHDELLTQRLRQSFARSRISVSEAEVDNALASKSNEQFHLAHILIALPDGATPDQIATGQKKIEGVKALIDKGEMEFAAAAVRYSDSPNALEGGDLGWRSLDEIPSSFAGTIRTMQDGQVIGPIRGSSGFQLLQLIGRKDGAQDATQTVTQYQARHILIREDPDNGGEAAAKARIDTLRARIAGGADFVEVAKESSDDNATKEKGGELGWFTHDQFGVEFGTQVAALQDGQVSAPFKSEAGWHILQREATRQTNVNDENRRAQAREAIGQRKLEDEWERYLREMRGEAYVDIRTQSVAGAGAGGDAANGG